MSIGTRFDIMNERRKQYVNPDLTEEMRRKMPTLARPSPANSFQPALALSGQFRSFFIRLDAVMPYCHTPPVSNQLQPRMVSLVCFLF